MRYEFRPLGPWQGISTPAGGRKRSPFQSTYPATLDLLFSEAEKLGGEHLVLQVDLAERDIRTDGLPRANARYGTHPGVVVSFESRFGPLRYATDAFDEWQANLRAIALSLQALRAVDRYGVSKRGEQYTGWKALPSGNSFASPQEAIRWMKDTLRDRGDYDTGQPRDLYRRLAKQLHPDAGGEPADWERLDAARRLVLTT